jgi:hypothetical protein
MLVTSKIPVRVIAVTVDQLICRAQTVKQDGIRNRRGVITELKEYNRCTFGVLLFKREIDRIVIQ